MKLVNNLLVHLYLSYLVVIYKLLDGSRSAMGKDHHVPIYII
jgi:hypothetical protein